MKEPPGVLLLCTIACAAMYIAWRKVPQVNGKARVS